jgi:hypothetical protein
MELKEVIQKYGVPDKSIVGKLPKGGIQLDFVGHADVTKMLIEIDPEWTWEPCAFDTDGLPAYRVENGMAHMAGWLTLCGVRRLGVGSVMHNKPDLLKELISDFIRNAAMRFGVCLSLWTKQEWEDVSPSAPAKPVVVKEANPLVSADNIARFKKACADAGLTAEQVAENANVDLNNLRESDMVALRASFKDLKEFAASPEPEFASTEEAVAAVIDMFGGEEVQPSIDNHPAGGGKPQIKDPGGSPSTKQLGMIRALGKGKELFNDDLIEAVSAFIGREINKLDDLTKGEASTAIEALQR